MNQASIHTQSTTQPLYRRACALALVMSTTFAPALSSAAVFPGLIGRTMLPFTPPPGMLPGNYSVAYGNATIDRNAGTNYMTITQNQGDKVIINWDSFNIGSNATVRFFQGAGTPNTSGWKPNSNSVALNRIGNLDPSAFKQSVINGSLIADGKVYLINRNGVFFGPNAKVQVQSLVASAFDISDDNFKKGLLVFKDDHFDGDPADIDNSTTISNEGTITANNGGSVFFVGPRVQNLGKISAPGGKINLVGLTANGQVEIKEITETRDPQDGIYADTSQAGDVANMKGGTLLG